MFRFRVGLLVIFSQKCLLFVIGLLLRSKRPENLDASCAVTNSFSPLFLYIVHSGGGWVGWGGLLSFSWLDMGSNQSISS